MTTSRRATSFVVLAGGIALGTSARVLAAPPASASPSAAPTATPTATAKPSATTTASSAPATAPSTSAGGPAPNEPREKSWSSCVEYVPEGAIRPKLEASFPPNGESGYELRLLVTVTHGRGETVLPAGFRIERGSDAMRAIEAASFHIPETNGGSKPVIDRPSEADVENGEKKTLTTTLSLPFVALPGTPGRHALRLPPLPIAVGRANGQVMTVCTPAMAIAIEDPIANASNPEVRGNAPPRSQREEWVLARQVTFGALAALAVAAVAAWLGSRWSKRPKPVPVKPRVPPWVTALEELASIRASRLVEDGQLDVFVDRVNDCVRRYLGDRFGFDGLESTTEEIRLILKRVDAVGVDRKAVDGFLDDSDLVKFAKFTPGPEDCAQILARAETIVRSTIPPRTSGQEARP